MAVQRRQNSQHGHGRESYGVRGTAPLTDAERRRIILGLLQEYGGRRGWMGDLLTIERQRKMRDAA